MHKQLLKLAKTNRIPSDDHTITAAISTLKDMEREYKSVVSHAQLRLAVNDATTTHTLAPLLKQIKGKDNSENWGLDDSDSLVQEAHLLERRGAEEGWDTSAVKNDEGENKGQSDREKWEAAAKISSRNIVRCVAKDNFKGEDDDSHLSIEVGELLDTRGVPGKPDWLKARKVFKNCDGWALIPFKCVCLSVRYVAVEAFDADSDGTDANLSTKESEARINLKLGDVLHTRSLDKHNAWVSVVQLYGGDAGVWGIVPRMCVRPLEPVERDIDAENSAEMTINPDHAQNNDRDDNSDDDSDDMSAPTFLQQKLKQQERIAKQTQSRRPRRVRVHVTRSYITHDPFELNVEAGDLVDTFGVGGNSDWLLGSKREYGRAVRWGYFPRTHVQPVVRYVAAKTFERRDDNDLAIKSGEGGLLRRLGRCWI